MSLRWLRRYSCGIQAALGLGICIGRKRASTGRSDILAEVHRIHRAYYGGVQPRMRQGEPEHESCSALTHFEEWVQVGLIPFGPRIVPTSALPGLAFSDPSTDYGAYTGVGGPCNPVFVLPGEARIRSSRHDLQGWAAWTRSPGTGSYLAP